jgi:hypothetical protein
LDSTHRNPSIPPNQSDIQEHPETLVISLAGSADYASSLLRSSAAAARRRRFDEAEGGLRAAAALLGRTRASPLLHAAVYTDLARVLRLGACLKLPFSPAAATAGGVEALAARVRGKPAAAAGRESGAAAVGAPTGAQLTALRLSEAQGLLTKAISILSLDAPGQNLPLRSCLLELAACCIAGKVPGRAAAALRLAHAAAAKHRLLQLSATHMVPAAGATALLPHWLMDQMSGQEAHAVHQQQPRSNASRRGEQPAAAAAASPAAASALVAADGLMLRLALGHFASLQSDHAGISGCRDAALCQSQLLAMAAPLAAACPKMGAECFWSEPPVPPADCPEPVAGELMIQRLTVDHSNWRHQSRSTMFASANLKPGTPAEIRSTTQAPSLPSGTPRTAAGRWRRLGSTVAL